MYNTFISHKINDIEKGSVTGRRARTKNILVPSEMVRNVSGNGRGISLLKLNGNPKSIKCYQTKFFSTSDWIVWALCRRESLLLYHLVLQH